MIGNGDSLARQQFETDFQNGNQSGGVDMNREYYEYNSGYDSHDGDESFDMAGGGYSSSDGDDMEYDNGGRTKFGTSKALTAKQMARRDARHGRQPVGVGMRVLEEAAARKRRAQAAEALKKEGVVLLGSSSNWGSKDSSRSGTPTQKKSKKKKEKRKKFLDKLAEQAKIKEANEKRAMENPQNLNDPRFGRTAADMPKPKETKVADLRGAKKGRNLSGPQPRAEDVARLEAARAERREKKKRQIEAARRGENVGPQGVQHVVRKPEDNPDYVKQAKALLQVNPDFAAAFGVGSEEPVEEEDKDGDEDDDDDEDDLVDALDAPKSLLEIQAEETAAKKAAAARKKNSKGQNITALCGFAVGSESSSRSKTPYGSLDMAAIQREAERKALLKLSRQKTAAHFKEFANPDTREKAGKAIRKTSACRHCLDKQGNWKPGTYCPRGANCDFAHTAAELIEGRLRNTCGHETVVDGAIIRSCNHIRIVNAQVVNYQNKCCKFIHHVQTESGLRKETSEEFRQRVGYGLEEPKRRMRHARPPPSAPSAIAKPARIVVGVSYGDMVAARNANVTIRPRAEVPQLSDKDKDKIDAKLAQHVLGIFKKGKGHNARWFQAKYQLFDDKPMKYCKGSIEVDAEVRVIAQTQVVDDVKQTRTYLRMICKWWKAMRWNRVTNLWQRSWLNEVHDAKADVSKGKLSQGARVHVNELKAMKRANEATADLRQGAVLPRNSPPGNERLNALRPPPVKVKTVAPLAIGGKKSAFEPSPKKPDVNVSEALLKQMAELQKQVAAMSATNPTLTIKDGIVKRVKDAAPVPKVAVVDNDAVKAFSEVEVEVKKYFLKQAPGVLDWLEELGVAEFDDLRDIEQEDIDESPLKKLVRKKFALWLDEKFGTEEETLQSSGAGYNWKPAV